MTNGDFEEVQKIRTRKRSNKGYNRNLTHPLSNLIYCGNCGKVMYVRSRKDRPVGYICSTYAKNGSNACSSHYITEETIINIIEKELLEMLSNREIIDSFYINNQDMNDQEQKRQDQIRKHEEQIIIKQKQQDTLYSDRLEAKISEQLFIRMNKVIESQICLLRQELQELKEIESVHLDKMHVIESFNNKIKTQGISKNIIDLMVSRIIVYDVNDSVDAIEADIKQEELSNGLIVIEYNYNNWNEI